MKVATNTQCVVPAVPVAASSQQRKSQLKRIKQPMLVTFQMTTQTTNPSLTKKRITLLLPSTTQSTQVYTLTPMPSPPFLPSITFKITQALL
jgi:hypothetical protein